MLNRKPLDPNVGESLTKHSDEEMAVAPSSPSSLAAPIIAPSDALAGAFPTWDLLPPDAFVKRVTRKKMGEMPTL